MQATKHQLELAWLFSCMQSDKRVLHALSLVKDGLAGWCGPGWPKKRTSWNAKYKIRTLE